MGFFNNNVLEYILNKLAALGILLFAMCVITLIGVGFDLYEFSKSLSDIKIWGLMCGYALTTSMLIDLVRCKWIELKIGRAHV